MKENKVKLIAVIGNANLNDSELKKKLSYELGKKLIDEGYFIATGGLGGVMEYASKGAKESTNHVTGSILGFLPGYDKSRANEYIDIVITTGMDLQRNTLLMSACDAVVSIGGGSGTLNEISSAWQLNKLIIALSSDGWSDKLANVQLDKRRNDYIYKADNISEVIILLKNHLPSYIEQTFNGIQTIGK